MVDKKLTKHIGEQIPLNQNPSVANNNNNGQNNNEGDSHGNPIKPQETQKDIIPRDRNIKILFKI
jgi:hypothetical protein